MSGFTGEHTLPVVDVDLRGDVLATASEDKRANLWRWPSMDGLLTIPLDDFGTAVALDPSGARVAVADRRREVSVWDVTSGDRLGELEHVAGAIAWGADRVAVAVRDAPQIAIYDAADLGLIGTLEGHTAPVTALAFAPGGDRLISGSADRTARVWDVRSGQEVQLLVGHKAAVLAVALDDTGQLAITGGQDKAVLLWDAEGGEPRRQLTGHRDWIVHVAFHGPDRLVSASRDGRVRAWHTADGAALGKLDEASERVGAGVSTLDGVVLVGAGITQHSLTDVFGDAVARDRPAPVAEVDARCAKLITCAKDLTREGGDGADRGVELARMAREQNQADPAGCLNHLVTLPTLLERELPASCSP